MNKCKDCKYLDMTQKTSVGYVCTNKSRKRNFGNGHYIGHLKPPTTPACKTGFEPRKSEVTDNENI